MFPNVMKPNTSGWLVLINTVSCVWSHLNRSAHSIWSHLKAVIGTSLRETLSVRQNKRGGGASDRKYHISYVARWVQISTLKEYVPWGHVWDLPPFSSHSSPYTDVQNPPPPPPQMNIQDNCICRLKMYMQMQATLEHAQVVNKLTCGRNKSV